jgi:hypothetical protein
MARKQFSIVQNNLQEFIDVDASDGRSVPINMNFVDEGYLSKDTGFTLFGITESEKCHSLYHYKKKSGASYILRVKGTKMQLYNIYDRQWNNIPTSPTLTENAEVGYVVYNDDLWFGNAVESLYKFTGTAFTAYASAPKGNILEVFEDRLWIAGVIAEPLSVYYSKTADFTDFTVSASAGGVVKPIGTDEVKFLSSYYGSLLVFKTDSIFKVTSVTVSSVLVYVPTIQSGTYGTCSRKSVAWVENDLWFFTGREVRAIGFTDNVSGVFGVNASVLSEPIKETLKLIDQLNFDKVTVYYKDRRFYLSIPLDADTNDTLFVCHTLYKNSWTKYTGRDKARVNDFVTIDDGIYTTTSSAPYGVLKWDVTTEDTQSLENSLTTE